MLIYSRCETIDTQIVKIVANSYGPNKLFRETPDLIFLDFILVNSAYKQSENAGAKLDHITPRERHDAAEQN